MRWTVAIAGILVSAVAADARPPLHDPVTLNIGLNCQWQERCIAQQKKAMKRALNYVKNERPAAWRVQICNRNAGRRRYRIDWIGFNNCIRNEALKPYPVRAAKRRSGA